MPDCTAQQQAYNLAVATEAVRYAQMLVEAAEASLAQNLYFQAQSARYMAYMALQQCQMGGISGGGMRSAEPEMDTVEKSQRKHIDQLRLNWQEKLRAYNELADSTVK